MPKTVVGLMDHFPEAQATVRDLAAAGFRRESIGIVANDKPRGTLVTASAETDAMADRAAEIMRRHGAVDIGRPVHPPVTAANQAALNERVYEVEETAEVEHAAGGYDGPERRMASSGSYAGVERRKLI